MNHIKTFEAYGEKFLKLKYPRDNDFGVLGNFIANLKNKFEEGKFERMYKHLEREYEDPAELLSDIFGFVEPTLKDYDLSFEDINMGKIHNIKFLKGDRVQFAVDNNGTEVEKHTYNNVKEFLYHWLRDYDILNED